MLVTKSYRVDPNNGIQIASTLISRVRHSPLLPEKVSALFCNSILMHLLPNFGGLLRDNCVPD
jgi:hypothetical protein